MPKKMTRSQWRKEAKAYNDAFAELYKMPGVHAATMWTREDVHRFKPRWTNERCEAWLAETAGCLMQYVVETGNEYLERELGEEP